MRFLPHVLWMLCVSLPNALADENPRIASEKQPELRAPTGKPHFRCAKKIALGPDKSEVGCLIKKRNAYAGAPPPAVKPAPAPQREANGREQERRPAGGRR